MTDLGLWLIGLADVPHRSGGFCRTIIKHGVNGYAVYPMLLYCSALIASWFC